MSRAPDSTRVRVRGPVITAGVLLGTGLGGFVDGIVFHQILQWHSMLSSILPPTDLVAIKVNMIWDGLFHAFTWLMTSAGVALLFRAGHRAVRDGSVAWSTRSFAGALALGWGGFNVLEGLVDHEILGIHHVRPGETQLAWDIAFIAYGTVLLVLGTMAIRAGRKDVTPFGPALDLAPTT